MLESFLLVVGIYGLSILSVHLSYRHLHRVPHTAPHEHYVIITDHNQMQIEWVIRCLRLFSWLKGKNVYITLLDHHSTDDTLKIAQRLAKSWEIDIRTMHSKNELQAFIHTTGLQQSLSNVVTIEMNNSEDLKKVPLFR